MTVKDSIYSTGVTESKTSHRTSPTLPLIVHQNFMSPTSMFLVMHDRTSSFLSQTTKISANELLLWYFHVKQDSSIKRCWHSCKRVSISICGTNRHWFQHEYTCKSINLLEWKEFFLIDLATLKKFSGFAHAFHTSDKVRRFLSFRLNDVLTIYE